MYPDYDYGDYDDDYDENITGLIVEPPVEHVQPPMYRSKYRKSVQEEVAHGKYDHKTFGVIRVSLNTPQQFLRKNSGIQQKRPEVEHKHYRRPNYQHKLPAWEPVRLSKTSDKPSNSSNDSRNSMKNFQKENILNIKNRRTNLKSKSYDAGDGDSNSNRPKPTGTLSISGHRRHHSEDKQIRSKYLECPPARTNAYSKDRGKKNSINADKSDIKVSSKESIPELKQEDTKSKKSLQQIPKGRYISNEERSELLYGMKKKWDEMMRQFQALPFLTDTPPKAKRKSNMENDLKQLEKDIDEIERHPHIYVHDDDDDDDSDAE